MIKKKYKKAAGGMIVGGIGLGAVAGISGAGPVAGKLAAGFKPMGSIVAAGMVVDAVGGMKKQSDRMMRRRRGG